MVDFFYYFSVFLILCPSQGHILHAQELPHIKRITYGKAKPLLCVLDPLATAHLTFSFGHFKWLLESKNLILISWSAPKFLFWHTWASCSDVCLRNGALIHAVVQVRKYCLTSWHIFRIYFLYFSSTTLVQPTLSFPVISVLLNSLNTLLPTLHFILDCVGKWSFK